MDYEFNINNKHLISDDCLQVFQSLLKKGAFGQFKIFMENKDIITGNITTQVITKPLYFDETTSIWVLREKPLINKLVELIRFGSQENKFLYDIKKLELYRDSTGSQKPEYIIERPDLTTTNVYSICSNDDYSITSHWDTNRPKPNFK